MTLEEQLAAALHAINEITEPIAGSCNHEEVPAECVDSARMLLATPQLAPLAALVKAAEEWADTEYGDDNEDDVNRALLDVVDAWRTGR